MSEWRLNRMTREDKIKIEYISVNKGLDSTVDKMIENILKCGSGIFFKGIETGQYD